MSTITLTNGKMAGGYAQTFTPLAESNLALWFDASDFSTVSPLNNGKVSAWQDKSGNNNDATQGTGSLQPAYTPSYSPRGQAMLTFDLDYLPTSYQFDFNDPIEIFIVQDTVSDGTNDFIFSQFVQGGGSQRQFEFNNNASDILVFLWADNSDVLHNVSNASVPGVVDFNHNLTRGQAFINGVEFSGSGTPENPISTNAGTTMNIGGPQSSGVSNLKGKIGEIIVYNKVLSDSSRKKIRNYLGNKWGYTISE